MEALMASSKKKKNRSSPRRNILVFFAGLALPICLVAGWHAAYGQQESLMPTSLRERSADRPPRPFVPSSELPPSPARPAPKAAKIAPVQTRPAAPQEPAAQEQPGPSAAQEAALPQQQSVLPPTGQTQAPLPIQTELPSLRGVFQAQVATPTRERLARIRKTLGSSPKAATALEERLHRLERLDPAYYDFVRRDVHNRMAAAGVSFQTPQYFVWADRNITAQFILVGFYDPSSDHIEFLGADLMSSGNIEKGGDYFLTPVGVFENLVENFSYRALGTPNQEGWRGLGSKDSRVWDFGYQKSTKKYKTGETISEMRLLMHSTDPDRGEPRLGRTDSKGCVRISHGLNRFLDTYAILDSNYEQWAKTKRDSWLLRKDRTPVAYPGKYLIVGESPPSLASMPTQAKR